MPSYSYSPSMASHMRPHEATTVTLSGWALSQCLAAAGSGSSAGSPRTRRATYASTVTNNEPGASACNRHDPSRRCVTW